MFDFSGKGKDGIMGLGAQTNQQKVVTRYVSDGLTEADILVKGKNVHYWHQYAMVITENIKSLTANRDESQRIMIERRAINAGLRAVIRALLGALRQLQPNHPLVDKKNREQVFAQAEKEEMNKVLDKNQMQGWEPRERPNENETE